MWRCKDCGGDFTRRSELLKHYKLNHRHYGRGHTYPCTYLNCSCRLKTWNALLSHLSRNHPAQRTNALSTFKCLVCGYNQLSGEREYFQHIFQHLKNKETVTCVFQNCEYKTNIYENFKSHKYRKHSGTVNIFKPEICSVEESSASVTNDISDVESVGSIVNLDTDLGIGVAENLEKDIELKIASILLKLENVYLVSNAAVDELLQEFSYLIGSLSLPITQQTVSNVLQDHGCQFDIPLVEKLASALSETNPVKKAIGKKGPLSSAWRRKAYYKKHFNVVEPVEYILDQKNNKSFQYVSILKTLQQILDCQTILDQAVNLTTVDKEPQRTCVQAYRSFFDGDFFKDNGLLSKQESISLILYIDEFEICNPLGTSKRKHKICGVYWILGNLPPACSSALSSIYLAALIKSNDLKYYGYEKVLEPLIKDLTVLEQYGIFVTKLGRTVKGTVQSVVADNLGAHSIAGFVENFSGSYVCRFCTAEKSEFQANEVRSGTFTLRTKEVHADHLRILDENQLDSYCGVKSNCTLSKHLTYFNVTTGFPPDIVHDLFEGIVPFELALCLSVFVKKKYFTLCALNEIISSFNFKWADKANRPHPVALNFGTKKTVGGNAHENWSLIRFLPLLIGQSVPCEEPAWQILTDLKDIVDLVVSPVHTEDSIAYLDFKVSEHRIRFQEVFPSCILKPKHHFLEHYPHLIRQFGPLVALWTMRFEAKHSFFKRIVRNIRCFKNVLHSLSERHQYQIAHHLHACSFTRPLLEVTNVSTVHIDVLNREISSALKQKSSLDLVCLAKCVTYNGLNYKCGMILIHGSLGGLPEFSEILQMVILQDKLMFIVKTLSGWYVEHYRAFDLKTSPDKEVKLVEPQELLDAYPLADYKIGRMRLVTLKRYVHV
ncbi:uncharacterized protein LOC125804583 isoform X1 [Astyanax mexicanus]|uniref:uncharacterized protein LOC111193900 isoform X1 n=1 Tax=Astyanax mexicanus TaxID=7994 RepID=UPI0020CAE72B|nr:uncharacterized protein LOC111193900 isoform X1 [Astyanax mexicanus]XP_049339539.1 uncharacterized protein LOC125804583 isoform X1 [Astyanax mexicanus]